MAGQPPRSPSAESNALSERSESKGPESTDFQPAILLLGVGDDGIVVRCRASMFSAALMALSISVTRRI